MIYIAECDHLPHSCCIKKLSIDFWDFNLSQKYNVAIFYVGLLPVLNQTILYTARALNKTCCDKYISRSSNDNWGDFNHFNYRVLCRHCSLKQTVKQPTRGSAILSNMYKWYKEPKILPAIGLSDHQSILLIPACQPKQPNNINKQSIRKITSSSMKSLGWT